MSVNSKSFLQPLDRVVIALMLVLSVLIGLLLWQGNGVAPKVRSFSWQNQQIGVEDTSFILTFSRPMDTKSVEDNLRIEPPLPGKTSWAGRRMAYTLTAPAPYGNNYKVLLQRAQDRSATETGATKKLIQPFVGQFSSRDRALVYIGVEGEQGQLVLYNLTQQQKTLLTPKDLIVVDFKPYPGGDKILFSAIERKVAPTSGLPLSQLYTVTTGIQHTSKTAPSNGFLAQVATTNPATAGKIDLVLDNKDYQNLKFDLAPDGQTIVVQRVNKSNPGSFDLWVLRPNQQPQPLQTQPGGDFMITPDSQSVAVAQGQGVAMLPLAAPVKKPQDFLPQFGMVLGFSQDGSEAAMVKFNQDYTRSLFLLTNQGVQKELLRTTGSILSAQFDPFKQTLYCLLTQLIQGKTYKEQPYAAAVNLKTGSQTPLLLLPDQRDVQMSLSPDGLALLFDQVVTANPTERPPADGLRTNEGQAIATSHLWLLPLLPPTQSATSAELQPEQLLLSGLHPRWLS